MTSKHLISRRKELEGLKTNFGYTMKYNKKGTNIQGSFLLITHLSDGSIIRMKSNALYGLATPMATFLSKPAARSSRSMSRTWMSLEPAQT